MTLNFKDRSSKSVKTAINGEIHWLAVNGEKRLCTFDESGQTANSDMVLAVLECLNKRDGK